MNAIFSTLFKEDLLEAETRYFSISDRLGSDLHERVKNSIRSIIRWEGGDHVGPHGFPCKHCRPFPYYICYQIEGDIVNSSVSCMKPATRIPSGIVWGRNRTSPSIPR